MRTLRTLLILAVFVAILVGGWVIGVMLKDTTTTVVEFQPIPAPTTTVDTPPPTAITTMAPPQTFVPAFTTTTEAPPEETTTKSKN